MGNILTCCYNIKENEIISQEVPYENKYKHKFNNLKEEQQEGRSYDNNFLIEHTSYGNVIFLYNEKENSFHYYCDKNIPNYILEIISEKYVIQFDCKYIYHLKQEKEDEKKKDVKIEKEDIPNVYGKFKNNYNKERVIIESNINTYKYLGKFNGFNFIKKPKTKEANVMKISYADFKKKNKLN